tara:strand:+ start:179 stop:394 length:216 start_codon:yes stop_codon:yes gene_type:complete
MNEILTRTDYKIQEIEDINVTIKRMVVFIGCVYLSMSGNAANIPLLIFMYHLYMIFHDYIDSNPPLIRYFT